MPDWKYYTLTLLLYFVVLMAAILTNDIAVVFEIVGGFGCCITGYGLPGLLYLNMIRNPEANHAVETSRQRTCNKIGAVVMIMTSIVNFLLVIAKQFVSSETA